MEQPDTLIYISNSHSLSHFVLMALWKKDNLIKNNLEFICLFGEKVLLL